MALQSGLFKSQEQNQSDQDQSPGWTIDEQKPSFFSGFGGGVEPILKGAGQGVADGVAMLTHGLQSEVLPGMMRGNPFATFLAGAGDKQDQSKIPGFQDTQEMLDSTSMAAREFSKSLTGDPRTTGGAANIVQGFAKAATEFTEGSLVGGPAGAAAMLGTTEGYARYADLKDQGVDDATAQKSAILTGVANAGGAFLPMAVPGKFLANLSTAGTLLAQAGTGAVINTAFGAASTAGDAAILRSAGYDKMADAMEPWDKINLATSAITGMFFGAHQGLHELRNVTDPSVRDAAKVVQDRQQVINAAPGVPVDMKSMAVNRQLLESSIADLMTGKNVDTSAIDSDGATFARPDQDTTHAQDIIREEFLNSGVLDDAEEFDRWLSGEEPKAPKEKEVSSESTGVLTPESVNARMEDAQARLEAAGPELSDEDRTSAVEREKERLVTPDSVKERLQSQYGDDMESKVQETAEKNVGANDEPRETAKKDLAQAEEDKEQLARTADPATAALADRPDMEIPVNGEPVKAADALEQARMESSQVDKEADTAFETAVNCEARHA